jgi:hypothetical protein
MQLPLLCASALALALALTGGRGVAAQGSGSSSTLLAQECSTELVACDAGCQSCLSAAFGGRRLFGDEEIVDDAEDFFRSLQSSNSSSTTSSSSSSSSLSCFDFSILLGIQSADCPNNAQVTALLTCVGTALDCTGGDSAVCTEELATCIFDGDCSDCVQTAISEPPSDILSGDDCETLSMVEEDLNGAPECTGAVSLFNDLTSCINAAHEDGGCHDDTDAASLAASAFSAVALALTTVVALAMK